MSDCTPLFIACLKGQEKIVKSLLKNGCNINPIGEEPSPLSAACQCGSTDMVKVLLDSGARVNVTDKTGQTPLHIACLLQSSKKVALLLEANADVNILDKYNRTALYYASELGNYDIVEMLLCENADVEQVNDDGYTALHIATRRSCAVVVEKLLKFGSDINSVQQLRSDTPLHYACLNGYVDIIDILMKRGANVNAVNDDGNTPLQLMSSTLILVQEWFEHYILRLHFAKFDISLKNMQFIQNKEDQIEEMSEIMDIYKDEVTKMQSEKLCSAVCYYDILTGSVQKLKMFAKNHVVVSAWKKCDIKNQFPIYGDILQWNFQFGKEMMELTHTAEKTFSDMIGKKLPDEIVRLIVGYLTERDLRLLTTWTKHKK